MPSPAVKIRSVARPILPAARHLHVHGTPLPIKRRWSRASARTRRQASQILAHGGWTGRRGASRRRRHRGLPRGRTPADHQGHGEIGHRAGAQPRLGSGPDGVVVPESACRPPRWATVRNEWLRRVHGAHGLAADPTAVRSGRRLLVRVCQAGAPPRTSSTSRCCWSARWWPMPGAQAQPPPSDGACGRCSAGSGRELRLGALSLADDGVIVAGDVEVLAA